MKKVQPVGIYNKSIMCIYIYYNVYTYTCSKITSSKVIFFPIAEHSFQFLLARLPSCWPKSQTSEKVRCDGTWLGDGSLLGLPREKSQEFCWDNNRIEHLENWKLSARNCYQIYQKLNFRRLNWMMAQWCGSELRCAMTPLNIPGVDKPYS